MILEVISNLNDSVILLMLYPSLGYVMGHRHLNPSIFLGNHVSQSTCAIWGLCSCSSEAEDPGSGSVEVEMLGPSNAYNKSKIFLLHL